MLCHIYIYIYISTGSSVELPRYLQTIGFCAVYAEGYEAAEAVAGAALAHRLLKKLSAEIRPMLDAWQDAVAGSADGAGQAMLLLVRRTQSTAVADSLGNSHSPGTHWHPKSGALGEYVSVLAKLISFVLLEGALAVPAALAETLVCSASKRRGCLAVAVGRVVDEALALPAAELASLRHWFGVLVVDRSPAGGASTALQELANAVSAWLSYNGQPQLSGHPRPSLPVHMVARLTSALCAAPAAKCLYDSGRLADAAGPESVAPKRSGVCVCFEF